MSTNIKYAVAALAVLIIVAIFYAIVVDTEPPDVGLYKKSDGSFRPMIMQNSKLAVVVDRGSMRRHRDIATLHYWIISLEQPLMQSQLTQFNCKEQTFKTLEETWTMGENKPYDPKRYESGEVNIPNSPLEAAMNYACWLPWWKR